MIANMRKISERTNEIQYVQRNVLCCIYINAENAGRRKMCYKY